MFIAQGFKIKNNHFWKYIVGSIIVIIASAIGQIPWMIAVVLKMLSEKKSLDIDEKTLMSALDSNLTLFLMLFSFAIALVTFYFVIKYFHGQKFIEVTTSRKKLDWNRVFFSFGIWAIISVGTTVIAYFGTPENYEIQFQPIPFLILAVISILLIPIQTSTEEYIFRGYLMQGFAILSKNKWFPLLLTSLIFGLMHIANPEVAKIGKIILLYYIGTGLFLGILTLMDEGMELALGFHASNNLIAALLITSDWTVFQTHSILKDNAEPSAGFDVLLPVLVIFPILLFIFSKKYKWKNWKEKLTGNIPEQEITNQINELGNKYE